MASDSRTPLLPVFDGDSPEQDLAHKRAVKRSVDGIINGRVNWVVEGTLLATGVTSTTFKADNITPDCQICWQPCTSDAAALMTKIWIASPGALVPGTAWSGAQVGTFTVSHPSLSVGVVARYRFSIKG